MCTLSPEMISRGTDANEISMKDSFTTYDYRVSSIMSDAATTVDEMLCWDRYANTAVQTDPIGLFSSVSN